VERGPQPIGGLAQHDGANVTAALGEDLLSFASLIAWSRNTVRVSSTQTSAATAPLAATVRSYY
jgi:hypothetical protein